MKIYDVIIIGAGAAGLAAREEVAKKTDNYVVIDSGPVRANCARFGCMPSKALIQVAKDYHRRPALTKEGIFGSDFLQISMPSALEHVRSLREHLVEQIKEDLQDWQEDHFINKEAKLIEPNLVEVDGKILRGRRIILASGTRPHIPPRWAENSTLEPFLLTPETLYEQDDLPLNMAVIGLGAMGLELAQALRRLGLNIVGIADNDSLGGITDPELKEIALNIFRDEMLLAFGEAHLNVTSNHEVMVIVGDRTFIAERILVAMGSRFDLKSIGLHHLDWEFDSEGVPRFDKETLQIKDAPVFLAGDVNADRPILHEAADEGRIAGFNAVTDEPKQFSRKLPMRITFTEPNIAIVGKGYQTLLEEGVPFITGRASFENQGTAILMQMNKGAIHIYADPESGRLLGSEMCVPHGEHLAHLLAWSIAQNMTVEKGLQMPFYHPTLEEGLRTALVDLALQQQQISREPFQPRVAGL